MQINFIQTTSNQKSLKHIVLLLCFALLFNFSLTNTVYAEELTEAQKAQNEVQRVQNELNALSRSIGSEIDTDMKVFLENKEIFMAEYEKAKKYKASLENEVDKLETTYHEQNLLINTLELEASSNEDSRKALQGASKINASLITKRLEYSPFIANGFIDIETLKSLSKESEFPSFEELKTLLEMQLAEIKQSGIVTLQEGIIYTADGQEEKANILTAGSFFALAQNLDKNQVVFLKTAANGARLMHAPRELSNSEKTSYLDYLSNKNTVLALDLSRGKLFVNPIVEKSFVEHILAGGFLVWPILLVGVLAFTLGIWRYIKLSRVDLGSKEVLAKFYDLLNAGKFDEAKAYLEKNNKDVLTYNMLIYMLSHWNETVVSLEKSYEEAMLTFINPLQKGIGFIAVAAAVAPLMGLFGTVTGMISTFDVITLYGNSDPKLLSGGISIALVTTEVGLLVAIPLMFLHFLLSRKIEIIDQFLDTKGAVCLSRACSHLVESALSGYMAEDEGKKRNSDNPLK